MILLSHDAVFSYGRDQPIKIDFILGRSARHAPATTLRPVSRLCGFSPTAIGRLNSDRLLGGKDDQSHARRPSPWRWPPAPAVPVSISRSGRSIIPATSIRREGKGPVATDADTGEAVQVRQLPTSPLEIANNRDLSEKASQVRTIIALGIAGLLAGPVAAHTVPLTRDTGASVGDNLDSKVAGPEGPVVLEDFNLIEKLARFDRERIQRRLAEDPK